MKTIYQIWERLPEDTFFGLYDDDEYYTVESARAQICVYQIVDLDACRLSDYKIVKVVYEDVEEYLVS